MLLNKQTVSKICSSKELADKLNLPSVTVLKWETDGFGDNQVKLALDITNAINEMQGKPVLDYDNPELYKIASEFITDTEVDLLEKYFEKVDTKYGKYGIHVIAIDETENRPDCKAIAIYTTGLIFRYPSKKNAMILYDKDHFRTYKINTPSGERYIHGKTMACWAFDKLNQDNKLMKIHTTPIDDPESMYLDDLEVCTLTQYERYKAMENKLVAKYGRDKLSDPDDELGLGLPYGICKDTIDRLEKQVT